MIRYRMWQPDYVSPPPPTADFTAASDANWTEPVRVYLEEPGPNATCSWSISRNQTVELSEADYSSKYEAKRNSLNEIPDLQQWQQENAATFITIHLTAPKRSNARRPFRDTGSAGGGCRRYSDTHGFRLCSIDRPPIGFSKHECRDRDRLYGCIPQREDDWFRNNTASLVVATIPIFRKLGRICFDSGMAPPVFYRSHNPVLATEHSAFSTSSPANQSRLHYPVLDESA